MPSWTKGFGQGTTAVSGKTFERTPEKKPEETSRETSGQQAEKIAERFLCRQGLNCITRNYRCKLGEIDLIMQDGQSLVFVEVRYRKHSHFGSPAETVNYKKQRKLIKAAQHYLSQGLSRGHRHHQGQQSACRFDVVALTSLDRADDIQWLQHAFY